MHLRRIVQVIQVVQSENILLRFLLHGHGDDGYSCIHCAASTSDEEQWVMNKVLMHINSNAKFLTVVTID